MVKSEFYIGFEFDILGSSACNPSPKYCYLVAFVWPPLKRRGWGFCSSLPRRSPALFFNVKCILDRYILYTYKEWELKWRKREERFSGTLGDITVTTVAFAAQESIISSHILTHHQEEMDVNEMNKEKSEGNKLSNGEVCDLSFRKLAHLKQHMQSHSLEDGRKE
ncbi:hypothetical protein Salat_2924400 [Sesamum alatum]|uniref:C2H2-type domain-containing protein n=1 Tax=Sesamum alatum TaxID=300844 RepID=A0AAE2C8C3_9LAMI|nr:hypothetical protein Salat_2924400 [Sesamum alatum]